jgi:hypothetical protein
MTVSIIYQLQATVYPLFASLGIAGLIRRKSIHWMTVSIIYQLQATVYPLFASLGIAGLIRRKTISQRFEYHQLWIYSNNMRF